MTMLAPPSPQTEMFDLAHDALVGGDIYAAMGTLRRALREQRSRLPREEWVAFGDQARRHPLHRLLLESPFTRRAYEKPRGYAGDAVLMDLIYGMALPRGGLSPLGGMLYGYEFDSPCFQSVRTRRATLAREIDRVAETRSHTQVLAVASGHLREIEWSRAARANAVTITALDQDRDSLDCVEQEYRRYELVTVPATIGDLLRRSVRLPEFDLVYAAGLYDYLEEDLARTLTATLFRHVAPGGRLLIGNFTTQTYDAAFMEAFMDWRLIYRTPEQVRQLAGAIPADQVAAVEQFCDDNEHVAYVRLVKR